MTIKELETKLEIPRATIRFYEKEGLIDPKRAENGYRDYSEEDLERIKKIMVLRKVGIPVSDISDVLDGAKDLSEVLTENLENLQHQMEELRGSILLCEKMRDQVSQIEELNAEEYLNYIEEEEQKGNRFLDLAKDIAEEERNVLARHFSATDRDGRPYASWKGILINAAIIWAFAGCLISLERKEWSWRSFRDAAVGIGIVLLLELILSLPLYFLGKRFPWIKKHRNAILIGVALMFCMILLGGGFLLNL